MKPRKSKRATDPRRRRRAGPATSDPYVLRLYVAGATPLSANAIANLREICESSLRGRYDLKVIDLYQQGPLEKDEQIVAVPTLIKALPLPLRRVVGDLSDRQRVLIGIDLAPRNTPTRARR